MVQAVLLACTMNAVRSPMAAAMLRHLARGLHVESAGVRAGELDPLAVEAMDEIGLAIAKHKPRCFEDLEDGSEQGRVLLSLAPLRKTVKDYFLVCENYYKAIRTAPPHQIESLDMARRTLHDEGARELQARLADKVQSDFDTARRLFTLICVLQMRG